MTVDDLIARIEGGHYPQVLDEDYSGSCPCFSVNLILEEGDIFLVGRCWRISTGPQGQQDLHVWGDDLSQAALTTIAVALKRKLDAQEWYGPYTISLEAPRW